MTRPFRSGSNEQSSSQPATYPPQPIQTQNGYPAYPPGPSSDLARGPPLPPGHPRNPPREGYEPLAYRESAWQKENRLNNNVNRSSRNSSYFNGEDSGLETPNSDEILMNGGLSIAPREPLPTPGLLGIVNHGNTCYINAVVQCLSNTDALAHYFVSDRFVQDLQNKDSAQAKNARKFGSNGELTEWFAKFLKDLWFHSYKSATSRDFKSLVGRYSPDYRSACQQDAQEFLMWILDKVHEDLNTATKRRYKTSIKGKNYDDPDEIAEKTLTQHRRSHWSYINALFEAQFRSCVTCPSCGKEKLNFDPYMCVSVPVPQSTSKPLFVTMVYMNRLPRQLCLGLNADVTATMREVKTCLAQEGKVAMDQLVLCEISNRGFHGSFNDALDIASLGAGKMIHAIETPPPRSPTSDTKPELIILAQNLIGSGVNSAARFGGPFSLKVQREISYDELCRALLEGMRPMLRYEVVSMRDVLSGAFKIRVADEYSPNLYLEKDVLMPLYMEHVDRTLSYRSRNNSGPVHLKLMLEWTQENRFRYLGAEEEVRDHMSAMELRGEMEAGPSYSLEKCLDDYIQPEYLEWTCRYCKRFQHRARKSIMFYSLPDVLIVHLKRFKQLPSGQQVKLDPVVSFPVRGLDLTRFTYQERTPGPLRRNTVQTRSLNGIWKKKNPQKNLGVPPTTLGGSKEWLNGNVDTSSPLYVDTGPHEGVYDLYATINHHGESMNSGHYTAFARNPVDGVWRHFDDTKVTTVDESRLVNSGAYILFYERRDLSPAESRNSAESGYAEHWFYGIPAGGKHPGSTLTNAKPQRQTVSRPVTPVQVGGKNNAEEYRSPSRATVENGELAREAEKRRSEEKTPAGSQGYANSLASSAQASRVAQEAQNTYQKRQQQQQQQHNQQPPEPVKKDYPPQPQSVRLPALLTQQNVVISPAEGGSKSANAPRQEGRQTALLPPPVQEMKGSPRAENRFLARPARGALQGEQTVGFSKEINASQNQQNSPVKMGFPPPNGERNNNNVQIPVERSNLARREAVNYANLVWDSQGKSGERKKSTTKSAIETDL